MPCLSLLRNTAKAEGSRAGEHKTLEVMPCAHKSSTRQAGPTRQHSNVETINQTQSSYGISPSRKVSSRLSVLNLHLSSQRQEIVALNARSTDE